MFRVHGVEFTLAQPEVRGVKAGADAHNLPPSETIPRPVPNPVPTAVPMRVPWKRRGEERVDDAAHRRDPRVVPAVDERREPAQASKAQGSMIRFQGLGFRV